jgi:hypothetical protein
MSEARGEKKSAHESWESFAERRIREAEAAGAFANLPGFGRPIAGLDQPLDENWWIRDKLRREQVNAVPPVLEARLDVERTRERLATLQNETVVRREIEALAERVRQAHFSHVPGPSSGVPIIDVECELERWRAERQTS